MDVDRRVVMIVHNMFDNEPVNVCRMALSLPLSTFSSVLSSKGSQLQKK